MLATEKTTTTSCSPSSRHDDPKTYYVVKISAIAPATAATSSTVLIECHSETDSHVEMIIQGVSHIANNNNKQIAVISPW